MVFSPHISKYLWELKIEKVPAAKYEGYDPHIFDSDGFCGCI